MRKWQLFGHLGKSVWGRRTSKCKAPEKEMSSMCLSNQRRGNAAGAQEDGGMEKEHRVGKPGRSQIPGAFETEEGNLDHSKIKGKPVEDLGRGVT